MENKVVKYCPLTGRSPLCSELDCMKEGETNYESCIKTLGLKSHFKEHK